MPVFQLPEDIRFPHPSFAEESGLLAVGGDLSPARLIAAYRQGIFPWFSEGDPLLWWFTSPRLVLFPHELIIPKRLARKLKRQPFTIRLDHDFAATIRSCAKIRTESGSDTWLVDAMQSAYIRLHQLGYAHSVECWQDGLLVGGLYGLRLDRVFFGESMFTRVSDASKIALVKLVEKLKEMGVELIDCQMTTDHLLRFGAREIQGNRFYQLLGQLIETTTPDGTWKDDKQQPEHRGLPGLR